VATYFAVGDRVQAGEAVQKLVPGVIYRVADIDERVTPFGNFVTYFVVPEDPNTDGPAIAIANAHLLLKKVAR
jgi:hypothetical protein